MDYYAGVYMNGVTPYVLEEKKSKIYHEAKESSYRMLPFMRKKERKKERKKSHNKPILLSINMCIDKGMEKSLEGYIPNPEWWLSWWWGIRTQGRCSLYLFFHFYILRI